MNKIAIIGASYLQLPLVMKAKEMGLQTHCFAWEEGADCKTEVDYFYPISVTDKEKILEKCIEIKIDAIVSIASDVSVPTVCFVANQMNLTSNSIQSSEVSTNKYLMRQKFVENNIKSPLFFLTQQSMPLELENLKFPLIVKPVDRSGSRGVQKVENQKKLKAAIKRAINESFIKQAIVEEFITGKEVSVESISWKGEHHILAITDKVTTEEPYFVELEHHQPSRLPKAIQEKIELTTKRVLNALSIQNGASHTEFKITINDEIVVIESAGRMGGDFIGSNLVSLSTGYDFLKGIIEVSLGYFNEPKPLFEKYSGIYFLCKETAHIKDIVTSRLCIEAVKQEIINTELKSVKGSQDRSGYLMYQSSAKIIL